MGRRFMAEHGNPRQWGPTRWPPEGLIRDDIEQGLLRKLAFVQVGTVHVEEDDDPRLAYERLTGPEAIPPPPRAR